MSHDIEAGFASSELANIISSNPIPFLGSVGQNGNWTLQAGHEPGRNWPLTDGVLLAENPSTNVKYQIAFEYKRPQEGLHGILTALGQCFTYLEKGYDASVMVIPEEYSSHKAPGDHINRVLEATAPDVPIWLYTYSLPDMSATRPFLNKLHLIRRIDISKCRHIAKKAHLKTSDVRTLWAHVREGMSYPNAFYRYCQSVKIVSSLGENLSNIHIPSQLLKAVRHIDPSADPLRYLSKTSGDLIADKAWRYVWFNYYFWNDLMPIYNAKSPTYNVNTTLTKIKINNTLFGKLFSGRSNSIKNQLVEKLNMKSITESEAWEEYAKYVNGAAHSYREVIDSGLFHIGFLSPDGNLTDLGYKFVDQCERIDSADTGIPMEILRAAALQNGEFGTFLHYIYKMSEEKFSNDLFAFCQKNADGSLKYRKTKKNPIFDSTKYLYWLDDQFANTLHLSKKTTQRAGGSRPPFQAERFFLTRLGFIKSHNNRTSYRVGVGLEINWPQVQNSMMYFLNI